MLATPPLRRPPLPRRHAPLPVDTKPVTLCPLLLGDVVHAVARERPGHAELHHGLAEIPTVDPAYCNGPTVAISVLPLALDLSSALHERFESRARQNTSGIIPAPLFLLRCVDAPEAIGRAVELDRIPVGDDRLGGGRHR